MIKIIAILSTLFITFYGAIFLLATATKQFKNRFFLGLFFLNSTILFIGHFLSFNEYWSTFRYFDFLFLASLLAFYPLYYMYIYSAFHIHIIPIKWFIHFIPAIIVGVTMLFITIFSSWHSYELYMDNNLYGSVLTDKAALALSNLYKGSRLFHLLQIVFYNFLIIRLLVLAKKELNDFYSNLHVFQLRYFYIVNISFILLMSIPGFYVTLIGRSPFTENSWLLLYVNILFTLLYIILAVVGLRQIPAEINVTQKRDNFIPQDIPHKELKQVESDLLFYFKKEKPWLDPNLTILEVAKHIGSNRTYVSKIINDYMGCNFNNFVNSYRINEAKNLLDKTPDLSIAEISDLAGFGSVNSFIRILKKVENKTPTELKKKSA